MRVGSAVWPVRCPGTLRSVMPVSTPSDRDNYLFDLRGYLILRQAIPPEQLARLNAAFDRFPMDLASWDWWNGAQRSDADDAR